MDETTLVLQMRSIEGRSSELPAPSDSFVLGRSSRADVTIPDRSLSRQHALLSLQNGQWFVKDLGSRNGTLLNGEPVGEVAEPVNSGDVLSLGGSTITLRIGGDRRRGGGAPSPTPASSLFRSALQVLEESSSAERLAASAKEVELRQLTHRLAILNEVHQALARPIELEELLSLILDRVFEHLKPEEGAIFLRQPDGTFRCAVRRPRRDDQARDLCSKNLIEQVVEKGQAALVPEIEEDERFRQAMSLAAARIRSLVAAPLLEPEGSHGMIVLASRLHSRRFSESDMELLVCLASVAAMRIRNVMLLQEAITRKRLERDIELARRIQVSILPDRIPEPAGYRIHAGNMPSRGVSGDFYKVVERNGGRDLVLMVADVSGKGIGASLLTGSLEALSAAPIVSGESPDEICATSSRLLFDRTPPEKYATVFLGILDTVDGTLHYCNAGHSPGICVRASGTIESLNSTGPPVGLLPTPVFKSETTPLNPGDTLLLYTDGITEAENGDGEEYGGERLEAVCRRMVGSSPEALANGIEQDLGEYVGDTPFADDRTVLIVGRDGV
ncbi:MAG: SpoIIE family protein phosphatase [Acidobacteria bacterium]|jgi:phosphoserine phosphatase RsbU/P|nr:SpoIIE family protein phosphatase [Acidobacteriota bacterium]